MVSFANRCWKWAINTRRKDLERGKVTFEQLTRHYHLCSNHFEDSQFMNAAEKKRLVHDAVPTFFKEVPNPSESVTLKRKLPDYQPDEAKTPKAKIPKKPGKK